MTQELRLTTNRLKVKILLKSLHLLQPIDKPQQWLSTLTNKQSLLLQIQALTPERLIFFQECLQLFV